jgi:hypothetical protein
MSEALGGSFRGKIVAILEFCNTIGTFQASGHVDFSPE